MSSEDNKKQSNKPSSRRNIPTTDRVLRNLPHRSSDSESRSQTGDPFCSDNKSRSQSSDNFSESAKDELFFSGDSSEDSHAILPSLDDDETISNPFCIFPLSFLDTKIKMTENQKPIPLNFINSMTKLGEIKNGEAYNNWTEWSDNLRSVLRLQKLWVPIDKPLSEQTAEEVAKCEEAFDIINLSVSNNVKSLIRGLNNSVSAWNALKNHYNKPTVINKVAVIRKLVNEKLTSADDLEGHLLRMKSHFQALEDIGDKWSESTCIALLLQSLTEEFAPLVSSFGAFDVESIKMEQITSSLMDEFKRRKSTELTNAMKSLEFNPGVACGLCRNAGHGPSTCGLRTKPGKFCTFCKRFGHLQSDCYQKNGHPTRTSKQAPSYGNRRRLNRGNQVTTVQWPDQTGQDDFDNVTNETATSAVARAFCYNAETSKAKRKNRRKKKSSVFSRLGEKSQAKKSAVAPSPKKKFGTKRKRSDSSSSYSSGSVIASPSNLDLMFKSGSAAYDDVLDLNCATSIEELNKNLELYFEYCFNAHVNSNHSCGWIVDSGATSHMCNDKTLFQTINLKKSLGYVKIADGKSYPIKGIGSVQLWLKHNNDIISFTLYNVNYVPQFDTNLISVHKLAQQGMLTTFDKHGCHAKINDMCIELGKFNGTGYQLLEQKTTSIC